MVDTSGRRDVESVAVEVQKREQITCILVV